MSSPGKQIQGRVIDSLRTQQTLSDVFPLDLRLFFTNSVSGVRVVNEKR